jgi:phosphoribosylaminoimidazolecarboxamide formyltransferase/IMP cyclohydrolase
VVIAPDADDDARAVFARRKNLRLLLTGGLPDPAAPGRVIRSVGRRLPRAVARRRARCRRRSARGDAARPQREEMADLLFAFRVCKHVKSNAIIYAKGGATVGIGAGQMSRVDSARIAAWKSEEAAKAAGLAAPLARGSVVASDAFFPFADGLAGGGLGRRHRRDPAGRLDARRRGDRRGRCRRAGHGADRHASLPALREKRA